MFGSKVIESVMTGRNYVRSLTEMQCLKESIRYIAVCFIFWVTIKWSLWWNYFYKELAEKFGLKNKENRLLKQLQNKPLKLTEDFNSFLQLNCNSYMIFKYWNTFLEMVILDPY